MGKKLIKSVVFLLLAAAMLLRLNAVFSLKKEDETYSMEMFYEQEKNTIDVMFYGSSHTYSDINPAVLWAENGIASYDLAGSLSPLWNTYYYMKESLKYQTPQVMVVELVRAIEDRDYIEEARTITNTVGMRLSALKYEAIQVSTEADPLNYLLGYPVYHSRYTELSREDFAPYLGEANGSAYKGFYPLFVTKPYDELADMSQVTDTAELSAKTEEYLRKIIALAKEEDIPLLFMVSPYQGIVESEQEIFNRCKEIAAEENVPFLDFNRMYEELELDPQTDFAEFSHLNHRGSTKLSQWLSTYLAENYDLPDRRGDEAYGSWELNTADWEQKYANQMLIEEEGWYDFLGLLQENPSYSWVISLDGVYDNGEQPLKERLLEIGMPETAAGNGGLWVHTPQQDWVFPAGTQGSCYLELAHSDLLVTVSQESAAVVYDAESQIKVANGLNILVYDTFTETLVEAIGFDAEQGYTCVR